jgi:uncharacterized protein involved in exopolysaccharide biosynthesis
MTCSVTQKSGVSTMATLSKPNKCGQQKHDVARRLTSKNAQQSAGASKATHLLHPGAVAKDRQRLELGRRIAEELEALLGAGDHALAHHRVEHARHRELSAVQLQVALLDAAGSEKLL